MSVTLAEGALERIEVSLSGLYISHFLLLAPGTGGLAASFVAPERLGTTPATVLCLLPLAASIAVVYKATKLETLEPVEFVKEVAALFGSIVVFVAVSAAVLLGIAWLVG